MQTSLTMVTMANHSFKISEQII